MISPDKVTCPGCGLILPNQNLPLDDRYNASGECRALVYELTGQTLSLADPYFIHQLVVDAYGAQHAGTNTKSITIVYALIGLCLVVEHGFTGRQVQRVHMQIPKQTWPHLDPPQIRATITVADVLKAQRDDEQDELIKEWVKAVWESWGEKWEWVREQVLNLIDR